MKTRNLPSVVPLCAAALLVAVLGHAQSLGELAKKEKERRKNNGDEARVVIDDDALLVGRPSGVDREPEGSEDALAPETGGPDAEPRPFSGGSTSGSLEDKGRDRRACTAQYEQAQAKKSRLEAELRTGVVPVTEIEGGSGSTISRDGTRSTGPMSTGSGMQSATVQGQPIPCSVALSNKREYRAIARRCDAITSELRATEAELKRALSCIQQR